MKIQDPDPVISEIRETRHRISARFGHDPRRLVAYYIQKQQCQRSRGHQGVGEEADNEGIARQVEPVLGLIPSADREAEG
jgi:hypothetical protein